MTTLSIVLLTVDRITAVVLSYLKITKATAEAGIDKFEGFNSNELEVEIKINGVDIPILRPMDRLQEQLRKIEDKAFQRGWTKSLERAVFIIDEMIEASD